MPLGFVTKSHGEIPVGFFNIETDMFLILDHFVFVSDLCEWIKQWAGGEDDQEHQHEFYVFHDGQKIGDLMGAISGNLHTGFIGELYKLYPFPPEKHKFKQHTDGWKNRVAVEKLVQEFTPPENAAVVISKAKGTITIGPYVFGPAEFHEVIMYIFRGGWPKWQDGLPPEYVKDMMMTVISSKHWLFEMDAVVE